MDGPKSDHLFQNTLSGEDHYNSVKIGPQGPTLIEYNMVPRTTFWVDQFYCDSTFVATVLFGGGDFAIFYVRVSPQLPQL